MRSSTSCTLRTLGVSGALIVPGLLLAQPGDSTAGPQERGGQTSLREITTKTVVVGNDEALVTLRLAGGAPVELGLRDGRVVVDGETVGSYTDGDALDVAWRELLADAIAIDGAPLGRALVDWAPPASIEDELEGPAAELDRRLEELLLGSAPGAAAAIASQESVVVRDELSELLSRSERLEALSEALAGASLDEVSVRVGEDVVIGEEIQLDATLVVIDGEVEILGEIRGDVIVVGGDLRTGPTARIEGDVRIVDGRLLASDGEIEGEVFELGDPVVERDRIRDEIREELRSELRSDIRRELRSTARADDDGGFVHVILSPFRWLWRAVGEVVSAALSVLLVGGLGSLVLFFGRERLEVVAETARRTPMRAGTVGLAGTFLLLPLWVMGIVALAVSLIGILALPIWIVFFPVAAALAAGLGYYAVVLNAGRWIADRRLPFLDWVRRSNPYSLMFGGALGLLAAFVAADMLGLFGSILGLLEGLLVFTGVTVTVAASLIGFGSVLITRGGRHPEYFAGGFGDPFEPTDWSWSSSSGAGGERGADAAPGDESSRAGTTGPDDPGDDAHSGDPESDGPTDDDGPRRGW